MKVFAAIMLKSSSMDMQPIINFDFNFKRAKRIFNVVASLLLFTQILFTSAVAQPVALRRPISNTSPLFLFNLIDRGAGPGFVELVNRIPVDLLSYSVINVEWGAGFGFTREEYFSYAKKMASIADSLGVWMLFRVALGDQRIDFSEAEINDLFRYRRFLGLQYYETATGLFCGNYPWATVGREISACAKNGGIVYWQDYTFSNFCGKKDKSFWTELSSSLIDTLRKYPANLVLDDKHNTYGGVISSIRDAFSVIGPRT